MLKADALEIDIFYDDTRPVRGIHVRRRLDEPENVIPMRVKLGAARLPLTA